MMIYEQGGGASNSGFAQVICGQNGEELTPDWQPDRLYSQDRHAGFDTDRQMEHYNLALVVVSAEWRHGITIAKAQHVEADGTLSDTIIYSLDANGHETGSGANCFENAARAAIEKAHCYHCRHHHFVKA